MRRVGVRELGRRWLRLRDEETASVVCKPIGDILWWKEEGAMWYRWGQGGLKDVWGLRGGRHCSFGVGKVLWLNAHGRAIVCAN